MAALPEYAWLVVVGAFVAFGFGWGTGANDVANAFATSVGSRTLTLRQAVIIAAIFEFAGALLLGRVSTDTIASGIANISAFERNPEVYAYGMLCALAVGTVWLAITSYLGLNVSSTHAIVGGIIGFALVWDGENALIWTQKNGRFPPVTGVVAIVLSWLVSPILTGLTAAIIFSVVRTLVLRRENAYAKSFWTLPPLVLITTWITFYFVFTKGGTHTSDDWGDSKAAWVSASIAAGMTILCIVIALPILKKLADRQFDSEGRPISQPVIPAETELRPAADVERPQGHRFTHPVAPSPQELTRWQKFGKAATHGMDVDIHQVIKTDERLTEIHESAERFEARVEYVFSYLQVYSAICVIFAHGAAEVGYMAGPLATIWDVYLKGRLSTKVKPPVWVVLICALGLVIGLATYGYNVTRAMGVKLAKITPSRGFSAELATAFVIMISSQSKLPTSSSQCITGAIVGVGILEGSRGVNWTQFLKQFVSWVATLIVIGVFVAAMFSQAVYAPSKIAAKQVDRCEDRVDKYEDRVTNLSIALYSDFNQSLQNYQSASQQGLLVSLPATTWTDLNDTVGKNGMAAQTLLSKAHTVDDIMGTLYQSLSWFQNFTVFTLGQDTVFPGSDVCIDPATGNSTAVPCRSPNLLPAGLVQ